MAKKTVENFVARAIRLYEQEPGEALASARLGLYDLQDRGKDDRPDRESPVRTTTHYIALTRLEGLFKGNT